MLKSFKEFMQRGDLLTIAVGFVMALATFTLIEALVGTLITPMIAAIAGQPNVAFLSFTINESEFPYGALINAGITFAFTAAAIYFLAVIPYEAFQKRKGISAKTRPCPECTSSISAAAKRCPQCTTTVLPEPA